MKKDLDNPRNRPPQPLTIEETLKREFEPIRSKLPEELFSLKSSDSITLLNADDDFKVEDTLQRAYVGNGMSAWNIRPGVDFVRGLLGKNGSRLTPEAIAKAGKRSLSVKPSRPRWAHLSSTPQLSVAPQSEILRRINGKKIFSHGYVFGNDARQPFYPSGYPWQCIGKLLVWTDPTTMYPQFSGTATLVGPNLILTAGHMAPWGADPWMVQFIPAYYNGSSILGPGVYSYVEQYRGNSGADSKAWDHALMKLYDPIGSWIGWLGTRTYNDDWEDMNVWSLVGYPGAIANADQPSWQGGISFHDDDEDGDAMELETDNGDSTPGDSGGPYFAQWDDGPHIVGVDSGGEEEYQPPFSTQDNNIAAGGKALVDLVKWGYANWGV